MITRTCRRTSVSEQRDHRQGILRVAGADSLKAGVVALRHAQSHASTAFQPGAPLLDLLRQVGLLARRAEAAPATLKVA